MLLSFQFPLFFSLHLCFRSSFSVNCFYKLSICWSLSLSRILNAVSSSFSRRSISLSCSWKISFRFLPFFNATVVLSPAIFLECPLFADLFPAAVYAGNFLSTPCASFRFATVAPSLSDLFVKVLLDCLSLPAAAPASAVVSKGLLFAGPFLRAVDATHFLLPPSP